MLFSQQTLIIKRLRALVVFLLCASSPGLAADTYGNNSDSKRIEVYSLSQNYWDTQFGDTLSDIAYYLLPNNPGKRAALQEDILHLNPDAFIGGDPAMLLAGKRLWLPGYMKQADTSADPSTTIVESYSWGNIKRQRK
jgi:hypothetical protein